MAAAEACAALGLAETGRWRATLDARVRVAVDVAAAEVVAHRVPS